MQGDYPYAARLVRLAVIAIFLSLAGCATSMGNREEVQTYTLAQLEPMSTSELAPMLLASSDTASVQSHSFGPATYIGEPSLNRITFKFQPERFDDEICAQRQKMLSFRAYPARKSGKRKPEDMRVGIDIPVKLSDISEYTTFAFLPGCNAKAESRFTYFSKLNIPDEDAPKILKTAAAAQRAAAGAADLPFRLVCETEMNIYEQRSCPADLRAVLAKLPLHKVVAVDRNPKSQPCGAGPIANGDLLQIRGDDNRTVWFVRMIEMQTANAEIRITGDAARRFVTCH